MQDPTIVWRHVERTVMQASVDFSCASLIAELHECATARVRDIMRTAKATATVSQSPEISLHPPKPLFEKTETENMDLNSVASTKRAVDESGYDAISLRVAPLS